MEKSTASQTEQGKSVQAPVTAAYAIPVFKSENFEIAVTATCQTKVHIQYHTSHMVPLELYIAQEATRNLWHIKKYLDAYLNQLSGSLTEEEFELLVLSFVRDSKNIFDDASLAYCISYLKALLPDTEYDDIAAILNVEMADVLRGAATNKRSV